MNKSKYIMSRCQDQIRHTPVYSTALHQSRMSLSEYLNQTLFPQFSLFSTFWFFLFPAIATFNTHRQKACCVKNKKVNYLPLLQEKYNHLSTTKTADGAEDHVSNDHYLFNVHPKPPHCSIDISVALQHRYIRGIAGTAAGPGSGWRGWGWRGRACALQPRQAGHRGLQVRTGSQGVTVLHWVSGVTELLQCYNTKRFEATRLIKDDRRTFV